MARPFFEVLRELRAGRTLDELSDQMAELVAAVKATGREGELRLILKLKPPKSGGATYILVEDKVLSKIPVPSKGDTVFFTTADNSLTRQDPMQRQLDLKPVDRGNPGQVVVTETDANDARSA